MAKITRHGGASETPADARVTSTDDPLVLKVARDRAVADRDAEIAGLRREQRDLRTQLDDRQIADAEKRTQDDERDERNERDEREQNGERGAQDDGANDERLAKVVTPAAPATPAPAKATPVKAGAAPVKATPASTTNE